MSTSFRIDAETAASMRFNEKLRVLIAFCERNGISFKDLVREMIANGKMSRDSLLATFAK